MSDYQIIDNCLDTEHFSHIKNVMESDVGFGWFIAPEINSNDDHNLFYLTHTFYAEYEIRSNWFKELLTPILKNLEPKAIIRAKGNLYPGTQSVIKHGKHTDFSYKHKGAIFYLNTNNGVTTLDDGTEIESIENRLLLFDSSLPHSSSTCSDKKYRINININYL